MHENGVDGRGGEWGCLREKFVHVVWFKEEEIQDRVYLNIYLYIPLKLTLLVSDLAAWNCLDTLSEDITSSWVN